MKNTNWNLLVLLGLAVVGCNRAPTPASFASNLWARFAERTGCKVVVSGQDATVDAATCSRLPVTAAIKAKGEIAYLEAGTIDGIMKTATSEQVASAKERCRNCSQEELRHTVAMDAVEQEIVGAFYCAAPHPDADWKRFCETRFTLRVTPLDKGFANMGCSDLSVATAMGREYVPWGHCK